MRMFGYLIAVAGFTAFTPGQAGAVTECAQQFPTCSLQSEQVGPGGQLTSIGQAWDSGWHDGFVFGVAVSTIHKNWCPVQPFSGGQLAAVVSKYVREHPELWGLRADQLVSQALASAYPCAKPAKR